jgi:succinate dehydrogenase/fumarate reductase flavoprotein subunit
MREGAEPGDAEGRALRAREVAAMALTGRWIYRAAALRKETRGLHRRSDFPQRDDRQLYQLRTSGTHEVDVHSVELV